MCVIEHCWPLRAWENSADFLNLAISIINIIYIHCGSRGAKQCNKVSPGSSQKSAFHHADEEHCGWQHKKGSVCVKGSQRVCER